MKKRIAMMLLCSVMTIAAWAQSVINGTVVSAVDGQPVVGATVKVAGTQVGTVTNLDGNFKLTNVPSSAKNLVVSYIGMKTVTTTIKNNLYIKMESEAEVLDEMVVIGYGSAKKVGSLVGSVGKVGSEKLGKVTTTNFTDALAGQVAGLSVFSANGDPSKTATIRLRGINTINASTTPLFILDGAPISSSLFSTLNPSDIETITVLKDAASTSIYGSRAANGVIVITSKKGRFDSRPTVSLKAQYGFSAMVDDKLDVMNSQQYKEFREKIGQPLSDAAIQAIDEYGISTNWRNEMFKDNAPTYDVNATIQGGGHNLSYFMSYNHHGQEGIIEQSGLRRETLRFNLNSKVNDWFKVGLQGNLGYTKYETNSENENTSTNYITNPAFFARFALPYDSPYYYTVENGKPVFGDRASYLHFGGLTTPKFVRDNREVMRRKVTMNMVSFQELTPLKGLTLRAQQALDWEDYTLTARNHPYGEIITPMGDKQTAGRSGSAQRSFERYYQYTITNTAEYKFNIDKHFASFLAGQEAIIMKDESFGVYGSGITDRRMEKLSQVTTVSTEDLSEGLTERTSNSYFFNANYNYDEKYYFDGTIRRDGSSTFAPGHRWGTFYSIGARWDMKKENWLKDIKQLDELTLRASYGTVGNSGIGDYMYFGLIGAGTNYNGNSSIGVAQASNKDLTWETVKNLDLGFTVRAFDRVTLNFDWYQKKTVDMLMEIPYSYTTGIDGGYGNVGSMKNTGIDLDVKVDILKTKDFYWAVKANFNYNKNEITELFDGRDEYALPNYGLMYKIGHDSGELYYVEWAGVDPRDGKQMWYDKNGNLTKVYNEERDSKLIGKSMYAPYTGGFGTDFSWKGLSLSIDFAWAADKYMMSNDNYFIENWEQFCVQYNQSTRMMNIWTTPGQITNIPKFGETIEFDSHLVEDASFLRMKNITLQYELPKSLLKYVGLQKVNIFAIGRNLLTFTNYTGYDPEPERNLVRFNYPNTRQVVFGAEITF